MTRPALGSASPADQNSRAVLIRRDDTRCSIRQVVSPIMNDRQEFCGLVIVFQDFTDARALQRQLAYAAAHDALTGLANRSSFIRTMEELVDRSRKAGTARSAGEHHFMFIDLDHFKLVNDTGGHAAGDALLKRVAEAIRGALGPEDIVARLGGDEFAVILKAGPSAGARIAARSVIDAIRGLQFSWDGRPHAIDASIGLAPIHSNSGEVDEIIARADAACYAAKAAGRGCVSVAPDDTGSRGQAEPPLAAAS
ncbi:MULTISPECIES: diguanylate cyclase [unclassified Mesorhizobium]